MKKFIMAMALLLSLTTISKAETVTQIVAVIDGDIITSYDFYNRVNMALINTRLEKNIDSVRRLSPMVLQELIDESLKKQVAKKIGLSVSKEEIDTAIKSIANRNQQDLETFHKVMEESGLEIDTLRNQIEATILWNKYVGAKLAPTVTVADDEADEVLQELADNQGETEYYLEEIFYPVDNEDIEESAREMLTKIQEDLANNPDESFTDKARNLSKAPNGGQIGWVLLDTLSAPIRHEVSQMEVGETSPIIKTINGLSLVKVSNKRVIDNNINKISKDDILYKLKMDKLFRLQKKTMRDLKDRAFIEVKVR